MEILGIDVGGSGIKGAPVETVNGMLLDNRHRIPTPEKAKPKAVVDVIAEVCEHFHWNGPVGVGFPSVVRHGVIYTAANIDASWIGKNAAAMISKKTGCQATVINDADAAGLAEMAFGAGKNQNGVVLIVTIGTGLGTALFTDGHLLPNTELGHIEIRGKDAELRASDAARKEQGLSWKKWAVRFDEYLGKLEALFWPDLIILGGGASKDHERYANYLKLKTEIVPAQLLNDAGIIGAAMAAIQTS